MRFNYFFIIDKNIELQSFGMLIEHFIWFMCLNSPNYFRFTLLWDRKKYETKADYDAVFRPMLYQLSTVPALGSITVDFEHATWQQLHQVLPDVQLRGCVFHFTQAVWCKIQELGMQKHTIGKPVPTTSAVDVPFLSAAYILSLFAKIKKVDS